MQPHAKKCKLLKSNSLHFFVLRTSARTCELSVYAGLGCNLKYVAKAGEPVGLLRST